MKPSSKVEDTAAATAALNAHAEASKMLEAALQQMDGIIAGTQSEAPSASLDHKFRSLSISEALDTVKLAMQAQKDLSHVYIPPDTRKILLQLLRLSSPTQKVTKTSLLNYKESCF